MPEQKCPKECEDCIHCEVCGMVHADKGEPCAFQERPITTMDMLMAQLGYQVR